MKLVLTLVVSVIALLPSMSYADQVVLTNGDRLTGTIVKSDGKTLTLKTELAGSIEIQWNGIKELVSDNPLFVTTTSAAQPISGTIAAKENTVAVSTSTRGTVNVPKAEVSALRSPADQQAYEESLHPNLMHGWNGGLNVGFALTGGNSQTTNLGLAFNAARPTANDKLSMFADAVYATNNAAGAIPSTTANNVDGGLRYDRNITPRLFGFGNTAFQTNALQDLDLRALFGGGLGFHVIQSERTTLDLLGGANYTHESYTTFSRNFAALQVGDEFTHKFGAGTSLVQKFFFFPNMSNTGEYYTTFALGTVTKLSKWLGWQNSFSDIYVSNPPGGKKKNDLIFTTGLNVSFTH